MPRMKQTAKGKRIRTDLEETPEDGERCHALAGDQIQNYRPPETPDIKEKIQNERQHEYSDASLRTDEVVKPTTVEETVPEECCASADTGLVKKRKVEATSEGVKKSRASMKVAQAEDQTDRQLAGPEDSQQAGQKETEKELKCYAQDTMNELLGMFGYDGVDEEEASNLHVSSSFVPPPPPPPPAPQPAPAQQEETLGRCTWCKKTFKGAALKFVLKLPGETQAYCSADCITQGKAANVSSLQAIPNETEKEHKYSARDAMNELIGMYMSDGVDEDKTLSSSALNHSPSSTDQESIPDTMEGCMLCKVKTTALDFVLKLPDGNLQAYCSGLCLARGRALVKKMSSGSFRPFFSHRLYNHNKELRSSTQHGNKVSHKEQCAESSDQTKQPAETQEEMKTGMSCCMWCNKAAEALDFVLKLPDGKRLTYCSVECLSKGKKVHARRSNTTSQPLRRTQDKTFATRNGNKVSCKEQCAESHGQSKRTKSKNSCVFWLCHCCKKTISGDRVITTDGGKFCSEVCVRRHKRLQ